METSVSNSHAELITLLCEKALAESDLTFSDLQAVAVSQGPGSYTGLRIGASTAKGFCYALDIPLIAVSTLKAMALGLLSQTLLTENVLFCPMIDARRMEVYNEIFNSNLQVIQPVQATIVDETSFNPYLQNHTIVFGGDGAAKCQPLLGHHKNAVFVHDYTPSASWVAELAHAHYLSDQFTDTAYFEPYYLKDFIAGIPRVKGLY
jgi:tRNA threonylcarbamoyladenosine biosynthesis protein TsaB